MKFIFNVKHKRFKPNIPTALRASLTTAFVFWGVNAAFAQSITGKVTDESGGGLMGVRAFWLDGAGGTETDPDGAFRLPQPSVFPARLIFNAVGYRNDTALVTDAAPRTYVLSSVKLKTVEVIEKNRSTTISSIDPMKTEVLSARELAKAACCNLSESFDTNPSVDVSYSDAVTGAKEIQMLGLAGVYTQISTDNIPNIRGLGRTFGLNYIPGTWIESIQLSKGTGPVTGSYESISGQINIALKDPFKAERLYVNLYGNQMGRMEANVNVGTRLSPKLATVTLLHGSRLQATHDRNADSFLDLPTYTQYNIGSRWSYRGENGFEGQWGAQAVYEDRQAGQTPNVIATTPYFINIRTRRAELFSKTGYVFKGEKYSSVGVQLSGIYHRQFANFGLRDYDGAQAQFRLNALYTLDFGRRQPAAPNEDTLFAEKKSQPTRHSLTAGLSYLFDRYDETFAGAPRKRTESVPSVLGEYTFRPSLLFTLVGGLRLDVHNLYGLFVTPRLHLRYAPTEKLTFRASAGRGYRVANIYADNSFLLASSRQINIANDLRPEDAWNTGLNAMQNFALSDVEGYFSFDYYYTRFTNQIVIDMDSDARAVHFYNLSGQSYAHALQAEFYIEPLDWLSLKTAYKWYDVWTSFAGNLLEKPYVARHRVLFNAAAEFPRWKFDATMHFYGSRRLPSSLQNPEMYRQPERAPAYAVFNAQATLLFPKINLDVYVGGENLTDFRQTQPIVAADQPFSPYFDTSFVWGPIVGRMFYAGLRWKLL